MTDECQQTYLMQVVLFVHLSLQLSVHRQFQKIRILFACRQSRVELRLAQNLLEVVDCSAGCFHFLFHRVLEVAREALDFLDLLLEIAAEPGQGQDNILLNLSRLTCLCDGDFIVAPQDLEGVVKAPRRQKPRGCCRVV